LPDVRKEIEQCDLAFERRKGVVVRRRRRYRAIAITSRKTRITDGRQLNRS
jgi:hypothetical protein